jgi:hypothetical protein
VSEPLSYVTQEYVNEDGSRLVGHWVRRGEFHSLASLTPVEDVERLGRLFAASPEMFALIQRFAALSKLVRDSTREMDLIEGARQLVAKIDGESK